MDQILVKTMLSKMKNLQSDYETHNKLFDIYEGNLHYHLDEWLSDQLSVNSYKFARTRIAPINVLKKLTDKLSTIYQMSPQRHVLEGNESDDMLLSYYNDCFKTDATLNLANEFFNMCRSTLIQPYAHLGKPALRVIPNDQFFVFSDDPIDPTRPTHIVLFQGYVLEKDEKVYIYHAYSKDNFMVFDSKEKIRFDMMSSIGNEEGINPFGVLPFVYVNRSANRLIPPADKDTLAMTLLIPGLMTDLNFASMFSLFSIIYGIDLNDDRLEMAPNAFWKFYSNPDNDKKPEIGQIKPEADVDQTLNLIKSQLAFWLQTRSIKPNTIGDVDGSNFASGISKMIDEADTSEERKKQIDYFLEAEKELWDKVINHMHPYWASTGLIDQRVLFSQNAYIETSFVDQKPLDRRMDVINEVKAEMDAGLLPKRRALKRLNPKMSDEEIEELLVEIETENRPTLEVQVEQQQNENFQD